MPRSPSTVTNALFLLTLFDRPGHGRGQVFTCSTRPGSKGFAFSLPRPDRDSYYCVSTVVRPPAGDKVRRRSQDWVALYVLVADDVGVKIDPLQVAGLLGPPTYRLETSPGSYHYGYVLDQPVTDRDLAHSLVTALGHAFTSDTAGLTRLVRLPCGVNTKPTLPAPFTCRLDAWHPDRRFGAGALLEALGGERVSAPGGPSARPYLPPSEDPVIEVLDLLGLLADAGGRGPKYQIECPWTHEHTGGDASGAVYIAPAGFKCWHHACANRTFRDLRVFLGLSVDVVDTAIAAAALGQPMPAADALRPAAVEDLLGGADLGHTPSVSAHDTAGVDLLEDDPRTQLSDRASEWARANVSEWLDRRGVVAEPPARSWLFGDLVLDGVPWMIAGAGGVGKGRLLLALAISVATGKRFGSFVPGAPGTVLILSKEDDHEELWHRFAAQVRAWQANAVADDDVLDAEAVANLRANLLVPAIDEGDDFGPGLAALVHRVAAAVDTPLKLVGIDPLGLWWEDAGNDRNNITSTQGAAHAVKRLREVSRVSDSTTVSVASVHHLNKLGGVTGSQQLVDYHRALFRVQAADQSGDRRILKVTLAKANASAEVGKHWVFEFTADGALWPARAREDMETLEEKAVREVHAGGERVSPKALSLRVAAAYDVPRDAARLAVAALSAWAPEALAAVGVALGGTSRRPWFEAVGPPPGDDTTLGVAFQALANEED